ncbi:MAG TPA: hypothetical protein VJ952_10530, partial [Opitutales bacterium]|nr:hypothetical protein [Opitutales bacterium]
MAAKKERHLYSHQPSRNRTIETAIQWFFRLATYVVIAAAGYIFVNIAWNGSRAVFKSEAPFINIDFLTQKPQTLHVYEPRQTVEEQAEINAERLRLRRERNNLGSGDTDAAQAIKEEIAVLQ